MSNFESKTCFLVNLENCISADFGRLRIIRTISRPGARFALYTLRIHCYFVNDSLILQYLGVQKAVYVILAHVISENMDSSAYRIFPAVRGQLPGMQTPCLCRYTCYRCEFCILIYKCGCVLCLHVFTVLYSGWYLLKYTLVLSFPSEYYIDVKLTLSFKSAFV